ncbi:MAG: TonB-dependent receptor [Verrucomicrobia bacterium]|nr:TonB-dependent receptor [Verrucomicrobiota bacterium]
MCPPSNLLPFHPASWRFALGVCLLASTLPGASAQDSVTLYKALSMTELMDLEVTSVSRRSEKLSDTASAIQVITEDDIRRSGASSIPEALRLASNLEVAQVSSSQWAISARGFNSSISDKLLVMIDGRTVYTPLYAGVFWDVQDTLLEDVDRIEVISGPGATLWGANAVNGVINITTKEAKDTQGLLLLGGGGTELTGFGGMRYGGTLSPNLHYRIYTKYFDRDSTLRPNGSSGDNNWHMSQSGFRLDWDATAINLITVQGDLYGGRIDQPGPGDTEVTGGNLLGRWTHTFSPDSDLKFQWYYDRTHRNIPNSISEDLGTNDFDLQHHFLVGERHNLVWGLGYRHIDDHVVNPTTFAFLPGDVQLQTFSGFAQDEIALVPDRLTLTLGTKIEHNDYTGWELQPSTRLAWRPIANQTVWGAISRAVRTPSRIDRDFYAPAAPPFTILQGGPGFESEKLLAYELGYRVQPTKRLALSVATFYNDYDDIRSAEQVSPPAVVPVIIGNGLTGHSYGAEFTADYHVTDVWRLQAGYTRVFVHLTPKPGSTDTGAGLSEANDANNQCFLRSSWDLPWHLEFDADLRHVGEIARQHVPAYEELDLRLGWHATDRLELSLVGQNLLDASHPEFGTGAARQEIERGVYAKVVWLY